MCCEYYTTIYTYLRLLLHIDINLFMATVSGPTSSRSTVKKKCIYNLQLQ
jgi:hypothetical protein